MILFPAIDLKAGRCVRLRQGDMARATIFNDDPVAQARAFCDAGFTYLHLVDLDGAFAGRPVNQSAVEAILAAVELPVQLGGGIRDMATLSRWLEAGVSRAIIGTAALRDPDFVKAAARAFPGRVAVALDARGGRVAIEGWATVSSTSADDMARRFEDVGVAALIYTDVDRDGMLQGIDWEGTLALTRAVRVPVIASGGLASMADVRRLMEPDAAGLEGAIAGRALYEGRIDAAAALALLASRTAQ